jgi:hypothetical protein
VKRRCFRFQSALARATGKSHGAFSVLHPFSQSLPRSCTSCLVLFRPTVLHLVQISPNSILPLTLAKNVAKGATDATRQSALSPCLDRLCCGGRWSSHRYTSWSRNRCSYHRCIHGRPITGAVPGAFAATGTIKGALAGPLAGADGVASGAKTGADFGALSAVGGAIGAGTGALTGAIGADIYHSLRPHT